MAIGDKGILLGSSYIPIIATITRGGPPTGLVLWARLRLQGEGLRNTYSVVKADSRSCN